MIISIDMRIPPFRQFPDIQYHGIPKMSTAGGKERGFAFRAPGAPGRNLPGRLPSSGRCAILLLIRA